MLDLDDLHAARTRITGYIRRTPLLHHPLLDAAVGRPLFIKPECLQHTGSFKFRGACSAIRHLAEKGQEGPILAYSSGNHAQGVAAAAQIMHRQATIVMPSDAPRIKIENTKALGAEVVLYDRATESREVVTAALMEEHAFNLVKPFDNLDVIAGQGSIGFEIGEDLHMMGYDQADVLICTGGGGLTSGIARALHFTAPEFAIYPVEPVGYNDVARSLKSGKREENPPAPTPLWDAVATPSPGEITLPIMLEHCQDALIVNEAETYAAIKAAFTYLKITAEPGGAIALAAALAQKIPTQPSRDKGTPIVAIVSGGNVDPEIFTKALR